MRSVLINNRRVITVMRNRKTKRTVWAFVIYFLIGCYNRQRRARNSLVNFDDNIKNIDRVLIYSFKIIQTSKIL